MIEEEKVNPVLKPTNKKFKFIDGWLVEVEESAMKLKITHKSGFYQCRVFIGERIDEVFREWCNDAESDRGGVLNVAMVINQYIMADPEYMIHMGAAHKEFTDAKQKEFTDEEHSEALEEVKKELEEKEQINEQKEDGKSNSGVAEKDM